MDCISITNSIIWFFFFNLNLLKKENKAYCAETFSITTLPFTPAFLAISLAG